MVIEGVSGGGRAWTIVCGQAGFLTLLPSRATRASRSPPFRLHSPKIRKKFRLFCRLYFFSLCGKFPSLTVHCNFFRITAKITVIFWSNVISCNPVHWHLGSCNKCGRRWLLLRYLIDATVRSVVSLGYGLAGMNSSSVTRSTRNSWNTWSSFESTRYCKRNQTNKNDLKCCIRLT